MSFQRSLEKQHEEIYSTENRRVIIAKPFGFTIGGCYLGTQSPRLSSTDEGQSAVLFLVWVSSRGRFARADAIVAVASDG